ncbi:carbohydrate ABC transporter permease [Paenibacillaceae bacterium WGS1546]|uniref:carbohydrate ABC transporter permease n=1 Tax=Cohnella sp. WGS1546 TaxID=3366810 RepID=UPI00372D3F91
MAFIRTRVTRMFQNDRKWMVRLVIGGFLLHFTIFMLFPIVYSLFGSFYDWKPLNGTFRFIGFENFRNILKEQLFWDTLLNTFYLTVGIVVIRTVLALFIALGIHSVTKWKTLFRTTYFFPVVTSVIAVSIVWKSLYDPTYGFINGLLSLFGFEGFAWLLDEHVVIPSIIIMTVWKELGYAIILFIAGLQTIPRLFYEAAKVDGASKFQIFRSITLPMLQPTLLFVVVTSFIGFMQIFGQIFILTDGGPGTSSTTTVYLVYQEAFQKYNFGVASALSFLLFAIVMIFTYIQLKVSKKDWSY